jgi:hypothetical protein
MRKNILTRLFFVGALAVGASACTEEYDSDSAIASWAKYPAIVNTPAIIVSECLSGVYTFDFAFDDKQVTDVTVEVLAGESSTATEGEDFELLTHEIELAALAGQDGFSVDIEVFEDFVVEDGDETIYLQFHSATPSGVVEDEILAITIVDSGNDTPLGGTADFDLSWVFTNGGGTECYDLDLTIQKQGSDPYADDLLLNTAATLGCPEDGSITISDMVDGEVYDIWVFSYADGDGDPLTVYLDYTRATSDFDGRMTITGVFDSGMGNDGFIVGTLEKNCHILTIKDASGAVIGEGRVDNTLKSIHGGIKKPI